MDEILFPFDPASADSPSLEGLPVKHSGSAPAQEIEERSACDAAGVVTVTIRNLTSHYGWQDQLCRSSGKDRRTCPLGRRTSET
jgi:hypothetical protein